LSVVKIKSLTAPNILTVMQNVEPVLTALLSRCLCGSVLAVWWWHFGLQSFNWSFMS